MLYRKNLLTKILIVLIFNQKKNQKLLIVRLVKTFLKINVQKNINRLMFLKKIFNSKILKHQVHI